MNTIGTVKYIGPLPTWVKDKVVPDGLYPVTDLSENGYINILLEDSLPVSFSAPAFCFEIADDPDGLLLPLFVKKSNESGKNRGF